MMGTADFLILGVVALWLGMVFRCAANKKKRGKCAGCCGGSCTFCADKTGENNQK